MDVVVRNGVVYTEDGFREAAVCVRDGRIERIGEPADADRVIDADGGIVLPGLVNAHTHAAMTLFRGYADDLPFDEWLFEHIVPVEEELTPEDIAAGARLAALEMIRTGTTAFADMYFYEETMADVVADVGLRATLGAGVVTDGKSEAELDERMAELRALNERDGDADGRVRTMMTPHAPYTCDDARLEELAEIAEETGIPYHLHVNETEGEVADLEEKYGQRPVHHLDSLGVLDTDAYVAHGVHLSESEIDVLAQKGVGVAHCPAANAKLAAGIAPVQRLLDAGVPVCLGTDGVASNNSLDMFEEMKLAALFGKARDRDAVAVDAESALEMATANGADAIGHDGGRLAAGEPADFVVLDPAVPNRSPGHDPLSDVVYATSGKDVTHTVVAGDVLYDDGAFTTLDPDAVRAEAEAAAEGLLERAGVE